MGSNVFFIAAISYQDAPPEVQKHAVGPLDKKPAELFLLFMDNKIIGVYLSHGDAEQHKAHIESLLLERAKGLVTEASAGLLTVLTAEVIKPKITEQLRKKFKI